MNQLLGVLLGGVLTLVGSFGAASLQARHQRKQTRAKDLWDRRASLYLDLLTHLGGRVSFAAGSDQFLIGYGPKTAEDYQLRNQLHARVALFASRETRDLWGKAADAALHLAAETFEGGHYEQFYDRVIIPETSQDPEYTRLVDAAKSAREELIARLRTELEVDHCLSA
ncbi:hypothetical protein HW130_29290 [Streptomyces sp. PKU-EA00015]|uniref:hypothetical protein n=1 Tax=Streptomyces sp. PKU-EA00015 TaxID=2748326 RepID=UPI0015A489CC|nr:hypothetical protein [Streptomyces sp. PKU-EA00015]NWF30296.1 hypothetical protein [Streptomyces sp. PKU-EA00015]